VPVHLLFLVAYSVLLVGLGLYVGRRVRSTESFFVAGRRLGPGLLFSTLLAANIGAGSTVGAAGLGYRDGLAAWWWVGAAALGSLIQAFFIGPRMRREAERLQLQTVGDYLEHRYGTTVRAVVAILLWVGTLAILAGQLIAMSTLLTVVAGVPKWAGCLLGGVVMTLYFTAGGLLSSAWVNFLQLFVLLLGFSLAIPAALSHAGGWQEVVTRLDGAEPGYWSLWRNGASGWQYIALLAPAFIISPGLLQKIYGARDDRAVRIGTAANALVLLVFAFVPPLLGIIGRAMHPDLANAQLALPTVMVEDVPVAIGALGLAALFSAEVSTADAILFMLSTSLSRDLYLRFVNRGADDARVLRVARLSAVAGGTLGVLIALVAQTIIGTLSFFYSVLGVCLFVPIIAGVYRSSFGKRDALMGIAAGLSVMLALQLSAGGAGVAWLTPAMGGLVASIVAAAVTHLMRRTPHDTQDTHDTDDRRDTAEHQAR
jgi:solute:Na+ symporter, SSS family